MEATEQTRLPQAASRAVGVWPRPTVVRPSESFLDRLLPGAASAFLFVAVLVVVALNEHPVITVHPGLLVEAVRALVPLAAAMVVTWAIYRPWPAYVAVLILTPAWGTTQMEFQVGPVQVILQTIFVAALIAGCVIRSRSAVPTHPLWVEEPFAASQSRQARASGLAAFRAWTERFEARRFAEVALVGFIGLAVLSTMASPDVARSATVLLHGILEPLAMGAVLVWLRPSRRDLVIVGAGLGISVAFGSLLGIVQALTDYKSLAALQAARLMFARVGYFNVGLYGVIVAMVVPLVVGSLAARHTLRLSKPMVGLLLFGLALTMTGLFFSLSKSAWLATSLGMAVLLLLLARTGRRRVAMLLAVGAVTAVFIPWPGIILQVAPPANSAYRSAMVALVGQPRLDSWNPTTFYGRGSMNERFYAVEGGVDMALDHPLLGVGLNEFGSYYSLKGGYRPAQAKDDLDHAHSIFPEVAAELGLPALVLLVFACVAMLLAMWRVYAGARDHLTRTLGATLFAALAAWIIAATAFGCDIYRPVRDLSSDVISAAVIIGMALALARLVARERDATRQLPS